ncbi:MAG: transcription antitermination factor NusB [Candidatus Latescibacteria bacterium]|nr:transcription antitermination factor NusB [Candidatus Latescibacterota bacterium]
MTNTEDPGPLAEIPDPVLPDNRHGARQLALQALYWEASSPGDGQRALGELGEQASLSAPTLEFATQLVAAVSEHGGELDALVDGAASHWRQDRIARIDGIILRLALAEILHCGTPARVAMDEAIELAKTYSGAKSYVFVNGVLDAVTRQRGLPL